MTATLDQSVAAIKKQLDDFFRVVQQSGNSIKLLGSLVVDTLVVNNPIVNLVATNGTVTDLTVSNGIKFPGQPNLLINPSLDIWQRGSGPFTTDVALTADGWQIVSTTNSAVGTISVTKETTIIDTSGTASLKVVVTWTSGEFLVQQFIENWQNFAGKTISFSVRVKTSTASAVRPWAWDDSGYTYGAYHAGDGNWHTLTVTKTFMTGGTSGFWVGVGFDASCTTYLDNGMLVAGDVAADYSPINAADDWCRCQRYYQILRASAQFIATAAAQTKSVGVYYQSRPAVTPTVTITPSGLVNMAATYPKVVSSDQGGARVDIQSAAAGNCSALFQAVTIEAQP